MRKIAFFIVSLVGAVPAFAQTTPTFGEKAIGSLNCNNGASATDFDTIAQCSSASSAVGTMQKAPLFIGAVTSPPYASVNCDAGKAGMIQWTGTSFKSCGGAGWVGFGEGSLLGISATNTAPARPGDVTTGLFSDTASTVSVATAGVSRLTVTASGYVGIGISPSQKLHVRGSIKSDSAEAATAIEMRNSDNGGSWIWRLQGNGATSNNLYLDYTGLPNIMTVSSGGNVGIGTITPTSTLDVVSLANSSWATQISNNGTTNAHGLMVSVGTSSTGVPFGVYKAGNSLFYVNNSGNVGIGTTGPATKLHVGGGDISIDADHGIRKAGDNFIVGYSSALPGIVFGSGTVTDRLAFTAGAVERMRLDTNGRVGIG
ncbi:MAG: hypothetical protein PHX43_07930, partial [Alphaproteobacteria bacterium]|nr:hypothetical protein [Alphaproteobacteria bacterium]